jgi:hypothetical protein
MMLQNIEQKEWDKKDEWEMKKDWLAGRRR